MTEPYVLMPVELTDEMIETWCALILERFRRRRIDDSDCSGAIEGAKETYRAIVAIRPKEVLEEVWRRWWRGWRRHLKPNLGVNGTHSHYPDHPIILVIGSPRWREGSDGQKGTSPIRNRRGETRRYRYSYRVCWRVRLKESGSMGPPTHFGFAELKQSP